MLNIVSLSTWLYIDLRRAVYTVRRRTRSKAPTRLISDVSIGEAVMACTNMGDCSIELSSTFASIHQYRQVRLLHLTTPNDA